MKASILILILLVAGAIYLFVTSDKGGIINLGEGVIIAQDGSIKGDYSIKDILGVGTPYECSFNKQDAVSQVSGTIKIGDNKVRGDFDIQIQSDATNFGDTSPDNRAYFASHFIVKDGFTYTWTSLQAIGYKSGNVESAEDNASAQEQAQIVGLEDKVDYECKPWNAVLNDFDLPSGVTFSELAA